MNASESKQDLWEYLSDVRRPIALYGTGDGADKIISVLERYGLKDLIAAVFASDGFVRDRMFHGFKVISYSECCKKFGDKNEGEKKWERMWFYQLRIYRRHLSAPGR